MNLCSHWKKAGSQQRSLWLSKASKLNPTKERDIWCISHRVRYFCTWNMYCASNRIFLSWFLLWFFHHTVISFPYLPCSRFLRFNHTLLIELFKRKQNLIKHSAKSERNGQESEKKKLKRAWISVKEKDERSYSVSTEQIKNGKII